MCTVIALKALCAGTVIIIDECFYIMDFGILWCLNTCPTTWDCGASMASQGVPQDHMQDCIFETPPTVKLLRSLYQYSSCQAVRKQLARTPKDPKWMISPCHKNVLWLEWFWKTVSFLPVKFFGLACRPLVNRLGSPIVAQLRKGLRAQLAFWKCLKEFELFQCAGFYWHRPFSFSNLVTR